MKSERLERKDMLKELNEKLRVKKEKQTIKNEFETDETVVDLTKDVKAEQRKTAMVQDKSTNRWYKMKQVNNQGSNKTKTKVGEKTKSLSSSKMMDIEDSEQVRASLDIQSPRSEESASSPVKHGSARQKRYFPLNVSVKKRQSTKPKPVKYEEESGDENSIVQSLTSTGRKSRMNVTVSEDEESNSSQPSSDADKSKSFLVPKKLFKLDLPDTTSTAASVYSDYTETLDGEFSNQCGLSAFYATFGADIQKQLHYYL
ncbi:hypothetical protein MAR_037389 [Mya arenaria]|uniref:Uncharacterized protein n=1 Tax=Mya arenaria TaxID=6604 RepID=A0ABY7FND5_MYAAR|nr:hypothetical protein MAR_037389 [Mya arenaria]